MVVRCLVPCVRLGVQRGGEQQRDAQKVKSVSTSQMEQSGRSICETIYDRRQINVKLFHQTNHILSYYCQQGLIRV